MKRVLVLAPHADDGEFSCGATIKRLTEERKEVYYAAFSPCTKSMPEGSTEFRLYEELTQAVAQLGIPEQRIIKFTFPVREFPANRQEILEEMVKLKKSLQPDLVLLPNGDDVHQDHHTIYNEGIRAFKHCSMLGYELPWNNLSFTNTFHMKVDEKHLEAKFAAISEYKSQAFRPYMDKAFFFGLAKVRGIQVNADFAEAFQLIRWVM